MATIPTVPNPISARALEKPSKSSDSRMVTTLLLPEMAHRVISLLRSNSVAFDAKRTSAELRLQNPIYEYAPRSKQRFDYRN
jgi:hypothetical protein